MGESKRKEKIRAQNPAATGLGAANASEATVVEPEQAEQAPAPEIAEIGERASRILRPAPAEVPEITVTDNRNSLDPDRRCNNCAFYRGAGLNPERGGLCKRRPPIAIVLGMGQDALGKPVLNTEAIWPPVRGVWECGEWARKNQN